ncbi:double-strand break repair enhancer MSC1 NDAI_0E00180 [Naumovozyma dairenensis CBS 421]|uniref:Meiotic sister chromatid recombination protein 1 n=1 Tax=Naumovozyma dairenensis (strain ATCC 10597 / BCRC 20456 / CBS 421 / NBRC 0211 / NRRL Y-12639) TaxID=1071378 RepID=G0WAR4_NAUDC|nr:hypothetical protein NDAI_0E00180 [Naumovozyma dairenensis CBS 421]CCD24834.1 hypothetical protein NDAI_0E00180 [Naumovozyma dairenensis CBS 421]
MKHLVLYCSTALYVSSGVLASSSSSSSENSVFPFDTWTEDDLKDYVNDHMNNLKDISTKSLDDLKADAMDVWDQNMHPKPWWKFWASDDKQFPWMSNKGMGKAEDISDWLFNSWSKDDLHKYLLKNRIKADANDSKDAMVQLAKKYFKDISKKSKASGYYPSSSYFKDWSVEDLTNWLDKYKISYKRDMINKKEDLMHLVRKNMYAVSNKVEKERLNLLDSMDLANKQFLNKAGELKENIFDTWSSNDLEKWLESHDVQLDEKLMHSHDYLVEQANDNYSLLKDDINWYLKYLKKKTTPFMEKSPENVDSTWKSVTSAGQDMYSKTKKKTNEVINDTFLIGIDDWSKGRLKEFLDIRDIDYSMFATKKDLIQKVRDSRNAPLRKLKDNMISFKDWSCEKRGEMASQVTEGMDMASKKAGDMKEKFGEIWYETFENWSQDDLKAYLESFGIRMKPTSTREEMIQSAKENTQWFFGIKQEPFYKRVLNKAQDLAKRGYAMMVTC